MGKAVGIDLGTTNSCVACVKDGTPYVIPDEDGTRTGIDNRVRRRDERERRADNLITWTQPDQSGG